MAQKTRMVWLPDGEITLMLRLFILTEFTNVTDKQTHKFTNVTDKQTHTDIAR